MSVYYTDEIRVIKVSIDDNGVTTDTDIGLIKARVDDFNELIINEKGQETYSEMVVFVSAGIDISNSDKIIITKKNGQAYSDPTKKWKVKKSPVIHNFQGHHREIYL